MDLKKICILLSIIALSLCFSSCSENSRIKHMTIVQAVGIDCENGSVKLTVQYLDVSKGTGSKDGLNGNITALAFGGGESIDSALKDTEKALAQRLFFGQNKLIVLGNNAEDMLGNKLKDFMENTEYSRPDVLVVKSKTTAIDILKCSERNARVPAEKICRQLKYENQKFTVNDYLNTIKENRLPVIEAKDGYTVLVK